MNDVNRTSAIKIIILPKGKMKMSKIWQFFFALSLLVTSLSVLSGCSKPDAQSKRDQTKQATCEKCFHYLAICMCIPTVRVAKFIMVKFFCYRIYLILFTFPHTRLMYLFCIFVLVLCSFILSMMLFAATIRASSIFLLLYILS